MASHEKAWLPIPLQSPQGLPTREDVADESDRRAIQAIAWLTNSAIASKLFEKITGSETIQEQPISAILAGHVYGLVGRRAGLSFQLQDSQILIGASDGEGPLSSFEIRFYLGDELLVKFGADHPSSEGKVAAIAVAEVTALIDRRPRPDWLVVDYAGGDGVSWVIEEQEKEPDYTDADLRIPAGFKRSPELVPAGRR